MSAGAGSTGGWLIGAGALTTDGLIADPGLDLDPTDVVQPLLRSSSTPGGGSVTLAWNWYDTDKLGGSTYASQMRPSNMTDKVLLVKRRQGFPRAPAPDDAQVVTLYEFDHPSFYPSGEFTFIDSDVEPGVLYYYGLLIELSSGAWYYIEDDPFTKVGFSFTKNYAFGAWGHGGLLYDLLPAALTRYDEEGHLKDFLSLLGQILDGSKTEVGRLLTLHDPDEVDAELLGNLAHLINWPVNWEFPEVRQRSEVRGAAALYKKKGRSSALETAVQLASGWDTTLYEGWRYLLLTNDGSDGCGTVDVADAPNLVANRNLPGDLFRYIPEPPSEGYHTTVGLLAELTQVTGAEPLTATLLAKVLRIYPDFLASYARLSLLLRPDDTEESFAGGYTEGHEVEVQVETTETYTGLVETAPLPTLLSGFAWIYSNTASTTLNDRHDLTPHSALALP